MPQAGGVNANVFRGPVSIEPGSAGVPWFFVVLGGAFLAAGLLFVALFPRLLARDAS
jgi:hypothetical protein